MKTNTKKMIIAILAVVMIFSIFATAFAESGTSSAAAGEKSKQPAPGQDRGRGKNRPGNHRRNNGDWYEDWFEDRIDARENRVDFSNLPENPTDEEIVEFFRKNFTDNNSSKTGENAPIQEPMKDRGCGKGKGPKPSDIPQTNEDKRPVRYDDDQYDWFEDWFENRIKSRERDVDFTQLPENPTDEQMIVFFINNFMSSKKSEAAPVEAAPVKDAPAEKTPVEAAPAETAPVEEAPAAPVEEAPAADPVTEKDPA